MNFLMLCRAWPIYCCLLEKRRWCSFLKHTLSFKSLITKSIFPPFFFFNEIWKKKLHEYDIIASSQASLNSLSQRGKKIYQKKGKKITRYAWIYQLFGWNPLLQKVREREKYGSLSLEFQSYYSSMILL